LEKNDKIEAMVNDWIDGADMESIAEYATSKLAEWYEALSPDALDEYYEDFINENQQL